jgi:hypothetical protein
MKANKCDGSQGTVLALLIAAALVFVPDEIEEIML